MHASESPEAPTSVRPCKAPICQVSTTPRGPALSYQRLAKTQGKAATLSAGQSLAALSPIPTTPQRQPRNHATTPIDDLLTRSCHPPNLQRLTLSWRPALWTRSPEVHFGDRPTKRQISDGGFSGLIVPPTTTRHDFRFALFSSPFPQLQACDRAR